MSDETELENRLTAIFERWRSSSVIVLDGGEARDIRDGAAELQRLRAENDRLREVNRRLFAVLKHVLGIQRSTYGDATALHLQMRSWSSEGKHALAFAEKAVLE